MIAVRCGCKRATCDAVRRCDAALLLRLLAELLTEPRRRCPCPCPDASTSVKYCAAVLRSGVQTSNKQKLTVDVRLRENRVKLRVFFIRINVAEIACKH